MPQSSHCWSPTMTGLVGAVVWAARKRGSRALIGNATIRYHGKSVKGDCERIHKAAGRCGRSPRNEAIDEHGAPGNPPLPLLWDTVWPLAAARVPTECQIGAGADGRSSGPP